MPARSRGMTLIELMVSMAIGLFLTWGAFEVYVQSKSNYRAAEVTTRLQENARFALEMVEPDLRLAGFWGALQVDTGAGIAISCDGTDVTAWATDFRAAVDATDGAYEIDCAPFSDARDDSDVLVVRHASERTTDLEPGRVQLQTSLVSAAAFDDGVVPPGYDATSETRDLVVHAYYVDNTSSFADGIPSLRRHTLVDGGVIEDQEMVSGVENLQVQLGLDTNGDGSVERYVDPDSPTVTEGAVGFLPDARVVAVRLWMLVRSEESPGPAWRDVREYRPLDLDDAPIVPGDELYPSQFQRLEVTKTVFLRNQTGPR
jgi:type IV pilus assembly protein PilW